MIKNFINTKIIFKKTIAMKMKKYYTVSEIEDVYKRQADERG